jgi:hypothetical protein
MKTFNQFVSEGRVTSQNTIPLDKESQRNLNKSKRGQIGPGSKPVPHTTFRLEPVNIPMK